MTEIQYELNLSMFTLAELIKLCEQAVISEKEYWNELEKRSINFGGNHGLN